MNWKDVFKPRDIPILISIIFAIVFALLFMGSYFMCLSYTTCQLGTVGVKVHPTYPNSGCEHKVCVPESEVPLVQLVSHTYYALQFFQNFILAFILIYLIVSPLYFFSFIKGKEKIKIKKNERIYRYLSHLDWIKLLKYFIIAIIILGAIMTLALILVEETRLKKEDIQLTRFEWGYQDTNWLGPYWMTQFQRCRYYNNNDEYHDEYCILTEGILEYQVDVPGMVDKVYCSIVSNNEESKIILTKQQDSLPQTYEGISVSMNLQNARYSSRITSGIIYLCCSADQSSGFNDKICKAIDTNLPY